MKKERLFAFLLAGVTAAGTLTAGTAVQASETTVNLNIEKQNTSSYTLTVPAEIALEASGDRTEWSEGITITGSSDKNVKVTAKSANDWNLVNDTKKIGYHLYKDHDGDETMTELVFEASEINEANQYNSGITKRPYIQVNADDLANAAAGEYSDVLTFTAETVEDGGDSGNTGTFAGWKEGDTIEAEFSKYGTTYTRKYVKNNTIEFREQLSGEPAMNYAMLPTNDETDDPKEKNIVTISEGGLAIIKVDPYTKQVTLTARGEERKVIVYSLKVNGEEWINSSTSGGDDEDDTDNLPYIRVTSDNKEELLGEYKNGTEDHIFGNFSDQITASGNAEKIAGELYSKSEGNGIIAVIYTYKQESNTYMAYVKDSNGSTTAYFDYDHMPYDSWAVYVLK